MKTTEEVKISFDMRLPFGGSAFLFSSELLTISVVWEPEAFFASSQKGEPMNCPHNPLVKCWTCESMDLKYARERIRSLAAVTMNQKLEDQKIHRAYTEGKRLIIKGPKLNYIYHFGDNDRAVMARNWVRNNGVREDRESIISLLRNF